jgi:hypothetical protein
MSDKIKSGKEVIEEFFAEIYNVPNVEQKTVDTLVSLYGQGKFTDKSIQNALDEQIQKELKQIEKDYE